MDDRKYERVFPLAMRQVPAESATPVNPLAGVPETVCLFGRVFFCCNCEDAAEWISAKIAISGSAPLLLTHVNVHSLRATASVPGLNRMLDSRAALLLEGIGLKVFCLLTRGWTPPDTSGTDLFPALLDRLCGASCRLFLFGGEANVVALAAQRIQATWPYVEIVGWRSGFFSDNEIPAIRDEVRRAGATLLLIGLGSPRQEAIALEFLQAPGLQAVWTVGGLFDFLSGKIIRAPRLVQLLRLEFLFRICIEPRRLAPRYLGDALWLFKLCISDWLAGARSWFRQHLLR
jgi:exopolysaccharide biosynthesis WecB/TagA/CpsF family protein